jgi:hypothetical protein
MGSISLKANNLLNDPIAFWRLEESSGNRTDSTNNGWTLSEGASSVANTTGKVGNAASFNGTSSKFLKNSSISVGSTFSVSCWVKLNSYNPNNNLAIWGIGGPSSTTDPITLFVDSSTHFFGIYNSQSNPGNITTTIVANLDTWYHVVSVFTPNDMKLYINGTLAGSETYLDEVDNSWTNFSLSNYYDGGATPNYPIDATIDEVGIWDLALTSDQILNLYNNPDMYTPNKSLISIEKQNTGAGKVISNYNYILNSQFNADNQYPIADGTRFFDNNYYLQGNCGGEDTCTILTNYRHNSPLLYEPGEFEYRTIANRTFHEINAPYNVLPIGHPIQPRLLKMFGVGSKFGRPQNIKTIINTASYSVTPPDYTSWTKYGVEQIVKIPSWATKVVYGVKYLAKSDDLFRENNFGGLKLNFRLLDSPFSLITAYRNYVNVHLIRRSTAASVDILESLYGSNIYSYFNTSYSTAASNQWLGSNIGTVKVRKRSSTIIDANTDSFIKIKDTIDIPTFSSSSDAPDLGNGRPDTVSLEMFFAEFVDYFVNSGPNETPSGSIYFYEPFIYFV